MFVTLTLSVYCQVLYAIPACVRKTGWNKANDLIPFNVVGEETVACISRAEVRVGTPLECNLQLGHWVALGEILAIEVNVSFTGDFNKARILPTDFSRI